MTAARSAFWDAMMQRWPDKLSRLSDGFYTIKDKTGTRVPFRMNPDQAMFIFERHGMDVILKCRQRGFTTVIQLDLLDDCLFIPDTAAGVIAHNLNDAKAFFRDKIKFAYDELPIEFREQVRADSDSAESLRFSNGSSIRVGTSLRSGTLQRLHISEYGKLCAKFPEKAEEVKSGAFNTVQVGQHITVESTAEGVSGHFHDICKTAQAMRDEKRELTPLDFKFHFSPWWRAAEYCFGPADTARTIIPQKSEEYFFKLESEHGVKLSPGQKAWYVKKAEQQGDKMKQEFPSTPEEAFEASIEGAYLSTEMSWVRKEGRICNIPVVNEPVDTFWDLGVNDDMVIWFRQRVGPEHRFIDYYANSGEGLEHYADVLQEKALERRWNYGTHYLPHDGRHRRLGLRTDSVETMALGVGIKPIVIVPRVSSNVIGVEATRRYLRQCWFDQKFCAEGITSLDQYRKEWDEDRGVYKNTPVHDKASHGYKAFETAARAPDMYEYGDDYDVSGIDGVLPDYAGHGAPDTVTGY